MLRIIKIVLVISVGAWALVGAFGWRDNVDGDV